MSDFLWNQLLFRRFEMTLFSSFFWRFLINRISLISIFFLSVFAFFLFISIFFFIFSSSFIRFVSIICCLLIFIILFFFIAFFSLFSALSRFLASVFFFFFSVNSSFQLRLFAFSLLVQKLKHVQKRSIILHSFLLCFSLSVASYSLWIDCDLSLAKDVDQQITLQQSFWFY